MSCGDVLGGRGTRDIRARCTHGQQSSCLRASTNCTVRRSASAFSVPRVHVKLKAAVGVRVVGIDGDISKVCIQSNPVL